MGIKIQCPSCKSLRAVNERLLGREIHCPDCSKPIKLPTQQQYEEVQKAKLEERQFLEKLDSRLAEVSHASSSATAVTKVSKVAPQKSAMDEDIEINFARPKTGAAGDDMDMTPMVDVTFLLLIFFMITASFSVQKSIQRPVARSEQPSSRPIDQPEQDPDVVTVQVDEFNAYNVVTAEWDRMAASKQDLIISLSNAHSGGISGKIPTKLIVQAHENCMHVSVINALDAGREANFESFQVTTVEQFD
jgi:biopolymer transport protein ExbD